MRLTSILHKPKWIVITLFLTMIAGVGCLVVSARQPTTEQLISQFPQRKEGLDQLRLILLKNSRINYITPHSVVGHYYKLDIKVSPQQRKQYIEMVKKANLLAAYRINDIDPMHLRFYVYQRGALSNMGIAGYAWCRKPLPLSTKYYQSIGRTTYLIRLTFSHIQENWYAFQYHRVLD
jgi:hypothetical protein